MLVAFIIVDDSYFPLFEFFNQKGSADLLLSKIEENQFKQKNYEVETHSITEIQIKERLFAVIIYKDEEKFNGFATKISEISKNVLKGDKVVLRQLLAARSLRTLEHFH